MPTNREEHAARKAARTAKANGEEAPKVLNADELAVWSADLIAAKEALAENATEQTAREVELNDRERKVVDREIICGEREALIKASEINFDKDDGQFVEGDESLSSDLPA